MAKALSEGRRRQVFAAVVLAQDGGLSVVTSREKVAAEQEVSVKVVQQIEKEGLKAGWPPLDS